MLTKFSFNSAQRLKNNKKILQGVITTTEIFEHMCGIRRNARVQQPIFSNPNASQLHPVLSSPVLSPCYCIYLWLGTKCFNYGAEIVISVFPSGPLIFRVGRRGYGKGLSNLCADKDNGNVKTREHGGDVLSFCCAQSTSLRPKLLRHVVYDVRHQRPSARTFTPPGKIEAASGPTHCITPRE